VIPHLIQYQGSKRGEKHRPAMVRETGLVVEDAPPKARKAVPPPVATLRKAKMIPFGGSAAADR